MADTNADGRSDLRIVDFQGYSTVLLGNSDGSFTSTTGDPADFPSPPAPDLNRDGYGDEVAATGDWATATGSSNMRLGRSDSTFAPALHYETGQYTSAARGRGLQRRRTAGRGGRQRVFRPRFGAAQ